jgi:dihydroorotate dehydrogenase electron transfer subunit
MADGIELVVRQPEAAAAVRAGQFFQLEVGATGTLLRRPYSVAWTNPQAGILAFLFSVVGRGSAWLSDREPGQPLTLIGPLGRGFDDSGSGPTICVAGGLGIAPFPALIRSLTARGRRVIMLQGARTRERLLPAGRFAGAEVMVATDDGSAGLHGPVTALLPEMISAEAEVFACGPTPMLMAMSRALSVNGFPLSRVQIALETAMGCGTGICLGCVAPRARGGYLVSCLQGPCVRADELDWSRMADGFH